MPDYSFYTTQYLGDSITGDDFPRLKKRAADQLARYKRMYTVTAPDEEAEMMAICAMADALYYYETLLNEPSGNISSAPNKQSIGPRLSMNVFIPWLPSCLDLNK